MRNDKQKPERVADVGQSSSKKLQSGHELAEQRVKGMKGKPQRSLGSNASCCTLAGAAHTKPLSISLFGKLQSSTKLIRSTDPDVETDNLQLKLWLAHVRLTAIYILSFFFTSAYSATRGSRDKF